MEPLLALAQRQPVIVLHLSAAVAATVLGALLLWFPKGTANHRAWGWTWVCLMAVTALTSVMILDRGMPNIGGFTPIHVLTAITLVMLPRGVAYARQHRVVGHRKTMKSLYVSACIVAGLFTLLPGRFLGRWLWGAVG